MIAQVREAAPREPGRLEGETHGPNYDRDPQPEQLLPNGVSHGPAGNSPADSGDLAAFYAPSPLSQDPAVPSSSRAFFQEAWPAQPERVGLASPMESSGRGRAWGGASNATLNWMARLGDFFRTQMQGGIETRTTMTRQQVMGASGMGGMVLQQEQLQHTTSHPASPHHRQAYTQMSSSAGREGEVFMPQEADPPLFGTGARRVMESWPHRAPLLHGAQQTTQGPATDPGSTGSIPRGCSRRSSTTSPGGVGESTPVNGKASRRKSETSHGDERSGCLSRVAWRTT